MQYTSCFSSPLGSILMAADSCGLTGLWFSGQKYFAAGLDVQHSEQDLPLFDRARAWLHLYFSGKEPDFSVPLNPSGTDFQKQVWKILLSVPYGETITYGEIASRLAKIRGISHMSPQAVGGAVGRNPISILIPCHRVIGADGSLTGYAGGLNRKQYLLELEKIR